MDDNVEDKMPDIKSIEEISTPSNPQNNKNHVHKPDSSIKTEDREINIHLTNTKQLIKSRLTTAQVILLILNIIGIIIFLAIVLSIRKRNNDSSKGI